MNRNDTKTKNFERLGGLSPKFTKMVLSGRPGSKRPLQAFWVQTTLETVPYKHFGSKLFFLRLPDLSKRHLPMGLGLTCLSKRYLPNVAGAFTYFKRPVQGLRLHLLHLHPLSRPLRGWRSFTPFKPTLTRVATSFTPFKLTFTRVATSFTPFKPTCRRFL